MRVVVQRVREARVFIEGEKVAEIDKGVVILIGVKEGDTKEEANWLVNKCLNLRIFEDDHGKFNLSLLDIQGEIIIVSQFTLYGDCTRGRRPSFTTCAGPELAKELYLYFIKKIRESGLKVETGIFGARMQVEIHNEGPVTMIIEQTSNTQGGGVS